MSGAACDASLRECLERLPLLINVSGIDGSGKTTQIRLLREWLEAGGVAVRSLKNSTGLRASAAFFRLTEAATGDPYAFPPIVPATLQFFTIACDTVVHHDGVLTPLLNEGATILLDRNKLCYRAYLRAYGGDPTWIDRILAMIPVRGPTLLYDVSASTSSERLRQRTDKPLHGDEAPAVLERARGFYLELAAQDPDVFVIDGDAPITTVTARTREALTRYVESSVPSTALRT